MYFIYIYEDIFRDNVLVFAMGSVGRDAGADVVVFAPCSIRAESEGSIPNVS